MPYQKKKPVNMKPAPESYIADIIHYRDKKKVIKEKIFVDSKPKKKLNNKNINSKK
jgi:hypothetical protein